MRQDAVTRDRRYGPPMAKRSEGRKADRNSCIVKMSSPHLLRAGDVIHHLGEENVLSSRLLQYLTERRKGRQQCHVWTMSNLRVQTLAVMKTRLRGTLTIDNRLRYLPAYSTISCMQVTINKRI